jgi:transcriptional regulator with XRE-family HTH domain
MLGLTQADLGAAVGANFRSVQKWECAVNRPSLYQISKIAHALGVIETYFFPTKAQVAAAA